MCVSECFAVFANAVHAREAFETVLAALTDPVNGLIRLLTPPFDGKTRNAVGYIEGYLPGVRENGGQYTHAAAGLLRCWRLISPNISYCFPFM